MTSRRLTLGLLAFLFIFALTLGPELVSARRSSDERSVKTKTEKSSEKSASKEEREAVERSQRTNVKERRSEQKGGLARVASFIKKIFVGEDKSAGSNASELFVDDEENDDDLPANMRGRINRQEYLTARQEWVNERLGMTPGVPYDPSLRLEAIKQMAAQKEDLRAQARKIERAGGRSMVPLIAANTWTEIGPKPVPNGQTSTVNQPVAGRTVAIAIHPTNPNIVYVGGAQAGVYRTLNGGQTWTPIFDTAGSLVIGALALAPSNPDILYVGTGEAGQCGSGCYAGIGVYRIDNASTTANLTGPINPVRNYNDNLGNPTSAAVFTGRAISKILVTPSDPSIIFVSTASAI